MRQDIIDIAVKEIGITEFPAGSNNVKYNDWFYGETYAKTLSSNQKEWCCTFYCWIMKQSGNSLGKGDFLNGFASVPFFYQHFKDKITNDPQPGDAVIHDWDKGYKPEGDWTPKHIGCFVVWLDRSAGTFYDIEGNTSTGSNSNGGQVQKRIRNMATVQCFINPLNLLV